MSRPLHIGLIGGIGVAATLVYYQRMTALAASQGDTLQLTISHGDIQTLIRNNLADDRQPQADIFARQIDGLRGAGCDAVAITSPGAHFCYEETAQRSSLPIISAIAPLDSHFAAQGFGTVGLLGTRSVMKSALYGKLEQTRTVALNDRLDEIGQAYQDMAVAGSCDATTRALFVDAGREMIDHHGADAIALAGTDLNLAFDPVDPGYPIVDAVDPHVALLVRLATGTATAEEAALT